MKGEMNMNNKKKYESPLAEIEEFTIIDIVTASMDNGDEETDPFQF